MFGLINYSWVILHESLFSKRLHAYDAAGALFQPVASEKSKSDGAGPKPVKGAAKPTSDTVGKSMDAGAVTGGWRLRCSG